MTASGKSRLGRGLNSLITGAAPQAQSDPEGPAATPQPASPVDDARSPATASRPGTEGASTGILEIPIDRVVPNPRQPRRDFPEEQLRDLASSIRAEGLIQPIVVRRVGEGFELIAGERRWRACRMLGLRRIEARVMEVKDSSAAILCLMENLQRENLNPIEEAVGFASLMRDFDLTQEAVAERVGKARTTVANALRLLQLDREIQGYLVRGLLTTGHAKALLGVEDPAHRLLLARQLIEQGASVREAERLVASRRKPAPQERRASPQRDAETRGLVLQDLEKRLASFLNTQVHLRHSPKRGKIVIEYFGNEDLQRLLERIGIR